MRMPNGVSLIAKIVYQMRNLPKTILDITGNHWISGCHNSSELHAGLAVSFFFIYRNFWQKSWGQSTLWKPQCHAPQRGYLPSQGTPPLRFGKHLNLCLYELFLWLACHTADSMAIYLCHIFLWSKKHCNFWFNWTASSTFCLQASNHIQPQGARPLFL